MLSLVILTLIAATVAGAGADRDAYCDVVIVGGSSAALGAALAAAEVSPELTVCLTDPTDWLGGQLTTSAVSAVDFGEHNRDWPYQSRRLQSMLASVGYPQDGNPGNCWVSYACYMPGDLFHGWIEQVGQNVQCMLIRYSCSNSLTNYVYPFMIRRFPPSAIWSSTSILFQPK